MNDLYNKSIYRYWLAATTDQMYRHVDKNKLPSKLFKYRYLI